MSSSPFRPRSSHERTRACGPALSSSSTASARASASGRAFLRVATVLAFATSLCNSTVQAAETDVPGARDPLLLTRVPYSWVVSYERDDAYRTREFVVGRVDKTRREIRVKNEIRTVATLERLTYQIPSGVKRQEVVRHYVGQLLEGEIFRCGGRDCGRSNNWANDVFQEAVLYGPDRNQFYLAGEYRDHLVALYVIERGNKRIYVHLEVLKPQVPVTVGRNSEVVEQLSGNGHAVIDGARPLADGRLPATAVERLTALAAELADFRGQTVYVVCHLYGSINPQDLLRNAGACSESAVTALTASPGPQLEPFAAGPFLPRATGNVSRIELVLPQRLDHD